MPPRLDQLLVRRGFAASRARARRLIEAGAVRVDGEPAGKPGRSVPDGAELVVTAPDIPYVSRAGLKLEAAVAAFELDPAGIRAVDVGASTGGFTDYLLQHGARAVVSVDVGTDQLHPRLRTDPRVRSLESTDIRAVTPEELGAPFDWLVADISFLSLGAVLPVLRRLVGPGSRVLLLVKPQFEVGPRHVGRGGVVRSDEARRAALERVRDQAAGHGLRPLQDMEVPLAGEAGNREFFLLLEPV
jgi:23S rRNA (cytidine1920-2'-O)/16S rRNA (cytidine1409-2'-O)-methyltransferase